MSQQSMPALSVVVVTRDEYRTLRPIVAALRRQTVVDQLELVIVAPEENLDIVHRDTDGFHSVRAVAAGPVVSRGRAAAHGVLAARAPIVALSENHCFPEPTWAERTLESHRGGWAAVGPAVANANPESRLSQVLYAFGYGPFPRSAKAGPREELPLHNSSYRKTSLPQDLETLQDLLGDERRLQARLRREGEVLYFDPAPVKWHINEATWHLLTGLCYDSGRRYGGTRSQGWPLWRRGVYALLTPLVSLPIARNIWSRLSPDGDVRKGPALASVIWAGALMHALGEAVSYVQGPREIFPFVEDEEFMIRERLGGHALRKPEIATLVALLDEPVQASPHP